MGKKQIKSHDLCACCKYRMGWGSQPSKKQKLNNDVVCNYLDIKGHSRVFVNGQRAYDGNIYCDKFEPGDPITNVKRIPFVVLSHDEFDVYKAEKIIRERKKYRYENKR